MGMRFLRLNPGSLYPIKEAGEPMKTSPPLALVAGAAGLIGSALCRYLLERGISVIALDNFITGVQENLEPLFNHPGFELMCHDICQPLPSFSRPIHYIFHLASPASPEDFEGLALEIMAVNSQGTLNLLELAKKTGARLLFASTSEVYGNPQVHPQSEAYWGHVNSLGPRSCYDESKRFGESLVVNYARLHQIHYVIARIFNTYGPRMRHNDGRVIPSFLLSALRGEPLLLHGGGQQTRSFCHVDDLVLGLLGLMVSEQTQGQVFNLGNPQEFTIEVLATAICEVAEQPVKLTVIPSPRQDDPERRCPDISRVRQVLGWEPQTPLREGLLSTYLDFKQRFGQAQR